MKRLMLSLFICLPMFLFSQSKLEVIGSLDFSNLHYGINGLAGNVRSSEIGKLNYHFGINYNQQLKENIWLKLGVGFASLGYKSEVISDLRYGSQHDGMGNFDPTLPGEFYDIQFKYNIQFLEIPIALRYEFSQKKWAPFFEVGISSMYYLQNVTNTFEDGEKIYTEKFRDEEYVNQIQFASTLAFGVRYNINEKWQTFIFPNFRFHLTKAYKTAPVKQFLWSGGIALGVRVEL